MKISKYSFGMGDRFGHQGQAQLTALIKAKNAGIDVVPVWNKSHREHGIVGTSPENVRTEADDAIKALGWEGEYYVDADHINMSNVDGYIAHSDFFTLDVADYINEAAEDQKVQAFVDEFKKYTGELQIPGINQAFTIIGR